MLRFYNTLKGEIETFKPIEPGVVKLYTCGPTVYDYAHIGNFRAYIFEDLLKRTLKYFGYRVIHVMNITDVDDKTIAGSKREYKSLNEFTEKYIKAFFEDIKTLNIEKADYYPRATEHIDEMVKIIKGLLEKGHAYEKDGSIYFKISSFPNYGRLSKIKIEDLKSTGRVDTDEYTKENIHDFVLWKAKKEGEPFWETELGPGRPGWHIECSAMSMKYLGETFDIHCGGVDNIFPHHENEIAQSEAYTGKKFVNYWLHCHHLIVNGEKMSKSKGNFYTLRDLLAKNYNPKAIRFLLMSTHYRKVLDFTFEGLKQANSAIQRIQNFIYELENEDFHEGESKEVKEILIETSKQFDEGLEDDLNISVSLTALFSMIKKINILRNKKKVFKKDVENILKWLKKINTVLGFLEFEVKKELPPDILAKIKEREKARREKNYALADKIREELFKKGIILEDTKEGTRWKIIK
ncbi:cysteine--tRNA ligase [Candidatus Aminicenantes bacterium AC-335-B20]|jgi:cysteinyl-tRNA synthetase|nr:cysteine--tRNA ligase [SCandidatus Aminicenantes bacterium Aminicenantia_JdfR_composite]MCP2597032.1 cysteine--tRNA ligase [Candidatus Aminicenantes bacterium AC-335-G13]MCP2599203.1 cysteine--tRNA ligase [Candidatus Aminicenantes bacterium AC-335-B20]MCP2618955.1 cysteine--tRNA ligase [Candidatus Aminicenantes bacterium AC-335-A11]MCP2619355.1 cysteine--tRNA ligase [Candidatus Aminicenantes bacterium AC-335-K20]MCP2621176.1 cysteine--tRNA ligase [Candidatus Aminicenantes bacterium AC-334-E